MSSTNPAGARLAILSSQPWTVTEGDALIEADIPADAELRLNGMDVTQRLEPVRNTGHRRGLVSGFEPGANTLSAVLDSSLS